MINLLHFFSLALDWESLQNSMSSALLLLEEQCLVHVLSNEQLLF